MSYAVSYYTGNLYILAISINNNHLSVMIYRTHSQNIRALYRSVDLGVDYDSLDQNLPIGIAANGFTDMDFVYINAGG